MTHRYQQIETIINTPFTREEILQLQPMDYPTNETRVKAAIKSIFQELAWENNANYYEILDEMVYDITNDCQHAEDFENALNNL